MSLPCRMEATPCRSSLAWIAARQVAKGCDEVVNKMGGALRAFAEAATAP